LPSYLAQQQRFRVTWDLAPENLPALLADRQKMIASTVQQAKPGSIILLHVMIATKHVNVSTLSALADCPLE